MKKLFDKVKLSHWPIIFLTIVLSLVFLLFLFTEKYIYTIIAFTIICFASFKLKIKKFPIILFIVSMLTKLLVILIIMDKFIKSLFMKVLQMLKVKKN